MEAFKPLEHKFKAFVFALFKIFFRQGQKDFKAIDGNKVQKVIFLRPEKIGDMVISFPVFDGLKKYYPHISIAILGSPRNRAIIKNDPRFDKIYMYQKSPLKDYSVLRKIRNEKYDCVVDMIGDDSVTALFISQWAAPGKPRIGIGKKKYQQYYDYNYAYRTDNKNHVIENTLKILDAFGIDSTKVSGYAEPYLLKEEVFKAEEQTMKLKKNKTSPLIGYNLSAGSPTRVWAEEKSKKLLEQIQNRYPDSSILLLTTPEERERAISLQEKMNNSVSIVPDKLNLTEVSAFIKQLDILITPDTSLVHIARAFQVPVVGLYSRFMKNFLLWRPYGQENGAVVSGCDGNIYDITVEQVFTAFCQVFNERKAHAYE